FGEPTTPGGATIGLRAVESGVYASEDALISDIAAVHQKGKKVYLSLGGADGQPGLNNQRNVGDFITSVSALIDKYDLDGIDVDFEGSTLSLDPGDTDINNPRSPKIVNAIAAIKGVLAAGGKGGKRLELSMAPETFGVQVAMDAYGGAAGIYIPIINAFRNQL